VDLVSKTGTGASGIWCTYLGKARSHLMVKWGCRRCLPTT